MCGIINDSALSQFSLTAYWNRYEADSSHVQGVRTGVEREMQLRSTHCVACAFQHVSLASSVHPVHTCRGAAWKRGGLGGSWIHFSHQ